MPCEVCILSNQEASSYNPLIMYLHSQAYRLCHCNTVHRATNEHLLSLDLEFQTGLDSKPKEIDKQTKLIQATTSKVRPSLTTNVLQNPLAHSNFFFF